MSAGVRSVIIAAFGLLVALILGAELGQSSRMLPIVVAVACVGTFVYVALFRTVQFEALVLGILAFGYIVGNRGFAQLTFWPNSFLYVGEVGMVACTLLVGARRALTRERLIPHTPLAGFILAFLIMGGIRLCFDTFLLSTSRSLVSTAIRDAAAIYYALFFFIAYQIGKNESARKFIERMMLAGFVILIPVAVIAIWDSDILNGITFRGYPLILYKGDLLATFLGISAFYFFLTPSRGIIRLFLRICATASLVLMLIPMSRAGLFGFVSATVLLLLARRHQFVFYQLALAVVALFIVTFFQLSNIGSQSDFFKKLHDRVASVTDFSGTGHYRDAIGDSSVQNTEFRLVWWKSVFDETIQKNPFFGLGFGHDLSADFVRTYYSNQMATWDTRSPHSIWMTVLGRMGVIGALVFSVLILLILREAVRAARNLAHSSADASSLLNWCAAVMLLCSALFGVVLEGPMGGILFWTFLGLACSQTEANHKPDKPQAVREKPPLLQPAPVH